MSAVVVADAWAILAYLRGEPGAVATVRRYLRRARSGNLRVLLNLVNLGEVYYRLVQLTGQVGAIDTGGALCGES